ncbi:MAG: sigma-54-dependent Fis family transcriptional regulator, partial [Spirochaetaceae bacterium]|nr:sigma-54-dependent Fis family transcriptional regulator [Spirochaetaceae bacterium]
EDDGRWIQSSTPEIVGGSATFQSIMDQALTVACYDISVVVRGETGTGKEVIARHIHNSSPRAGKPFVAVNCAAISSSLAESEFFGHEKGAFTGADRSRLGQFRAADGGTVFLDEIGDLPLETQAKLLRVLENKTLSPVGSDQTVSVDVRVIAATNRDLDALVTEGSFRQDLYERLAQIVLTIPPLRERSEDIPLLLRHFIEKWNHQYNEAKGLSEDAFGYLVNYPWPGNVRELQNVVSATCAMGRSSSIGPELLPPAVLRHFNRDRSIAGVPTEIPADGLDLRAVMHNLEKAYYEEAIERTGGNAEQAAKLLGLNGAAFRKAARERLGVSYREAE